MVRLGPIKVDMAPRRVEADRAGSKGISHPAISTVSYIDDMD